jgi:hypothetical protein
MTRKRSAGTSEWLKPPKGKIRPAQPPAASSKALPGKRERGPEADTHPQSGNTRCGWEGQKHHGGRHPREWEMPDARWKNAEDPH